MKTQEAINEIKSYADNSWGGLNEAFEVAIKALEKEIPKHIEEQTEDDRELIDYVCPNCKTTLQVCAMLNMKSSATYTTTPNC